MALLQMSGNLYDDVKVVHDAIYCFHSMVSMLEEECMIRDKGKPATELFIHINSLKREMTKMIEESERILRIADIDNYGPLSKYVRPYLAY